MDRNDLKDELLGKVAGGTQAEADAYMAELMKYYGVSTKAEAFTKMTEEQKRWYQKILENPDFEYNPGRLDQP